MQGPSFEQTWFPLTQVPNLNEIGPVVLEKKKWKVYDNDDDNDDDYNDDNGQIVIIKSHLNLRLRWSKKQESNSRPLRS